jgi:hypothetical protein
VERLINFAWISGFSIGVMQWIKLIQLNELITALTGVGALILIVLQIIKYINAIKQQNLERQDTKLHIKKEEIDLARLRRENKMNKQKSSDDQTSK